MRDIRHQTPIRTTPCRTGISRAFALGALFCLGTLAVSSAQASIIVQDDFSGPAGTPDSAKWSPPSDYGLVGWLEAPLDGSGHVDLNSNNINQPRLLSAKPSFMTAPTATQPLKLTMTVLNAAVHLSFGLSDWDQHVIELRNDAYLGATGGDWSIYMSNNGNTADDIFDTGVTTTSGTWIFNWSPTSVTLLFNDALVFDTAVNAPTTSDVGPAGWQIPTAAMVPFAYTYDSTGVGQVDSILFEAPEPSTMALFGVGALLLGNRRKRQRPGL